MLTKLLLCTLVVAPVQALGPGNHSFNGAPVSPLNPSRYASTLEWCDCGTGIHKLTVWPERKRDRNVTVALNEPTWLQWDSEVSALNWICDGMTTTQRTNFEKPVKYWMVQRTVAIKGSWRLPACGLSGAASGRLRFVGFVQAEYTTSIPYISGESGYACIKIPVLLRLASDSLLALAEARRESCSDFAWTDLVVKHSHDGGRSWTPLQIIRTEQHAVIGNAAPVQLSGTSHHHPGRILVPHTRNNLDTWLTYSDDDGLTWSSARQLHETSQPDWKWIGVGPPGSIQLRSGRILVPAFHGHLRANLFNNKVHGHVLLSDDDGDSWYLSSKDGFGAADKDSNENQAVELHNGSILINARSHADPGMTQQRIQTRSDDGGLTFGPTSFVEELPQPIDGCEGSIISTQLGVPPVLLYSGPDSTLLRSGMTLWTSMDEGSSWGAKQLIDPGLSGYSSLQADCHGHTCEALLLYEQSDDWTKNLVMNPDRFVFRRMGLTALQNVQPLDTMTSAKDGNHNDPMALEAATRSMMYV